MVSWWHARLLQMLVPHSSGPCTMYLYFPMKIDDREPVVVVVNENRAIYLPIEIVVLMVVLALPNNNRSI